MVGKFTLDLGNEASGMWSTIAGGRDNNAYHESTVVGGGYSNNARGNYSCVFGGYQNNTNGSYSVTCGGRSNSSLGNDNFVGGGYGNVIHTGTSRSAILGGSTNTIGEGCGYSALTGGEMNSISGTSVRAFIGCGRNNQILNSNCAAIVSGWDNTIDGGGSFIGSGHYQSIVGEFSAIPGGWADTVSADYSYAFGLRAVVPSGEDNSAVFNWKTDNGTMFIETDAFSTDYELYVQGDAYSTVNWVSSDLRLKKRIQRISDVLTKLDRLRPVHFEWENSFCSNLSSKAS